MDRIRRSLRDSFRRRSSSGSPSERHVAGGGNGSSSSGGDINKPQLWSQDEATVRAGTCSYHVKYLGSVEVGESRGMQICEEALKVLRANRRRPIKGILYVSGDGLRVVDSENKGLVVDQTIEKVSFCAPDRNHERGFAYICRDGTTRRWMCHGFHAGKDSGERLSHAVGCAFAVCLERKQKRDREAQQLAQASSNVSTPSHPPATSEPVVQSKATLPFDRQGSFRHAPINERIQDPQNVKLAEKPPVKPAINPHAVARPHGNRNLFERQGSLRMPAMPLKDTSKSESTNSSKAANNQEMFKRFNSLRLNELPSNLARYEQHGSDQLGSNAIWEEDIAQPASTSAIMNFYGAQSNSSYFSPPASELGSPKSQTRSASFDAPLTNGQGLLDLMSTTAAPPGGRPRGDEWLQTAAQQAKFFQHYRISPVEQLSQENVSVAPPPAFAPPPLPPRQHQTTSTISHRPPIQSYQAHSFDFGQPPSGDSSNFGFKTDPTAPDFDAKWNALTGAQQRRHSAVSDADPARQNGKHPLSATNPFSQESSSVNI